MLTVKIFYLPNNQVQVFFFKFRFIKLVYYYNNVISMKQSDINLSYINKCNSLILCWWPERGFRLNVLMYSSEFGVNMATMQNSKMHSLKNYKCIIRIYLIHFMIS